MPIPPTLLSFTLVAFKPFRFCKKKTFFWSFLSSIREHVKSALLSPRFHFFNRFFPHFSRQLDAHILKTQFLEFLLDHEKKIGNKKAPNFAYILVPIGAPRTANLTNCPYIT